jgi:hypothetical protein
MKTLLHITSIALVCLGMNNASGQTPQYTNQYGTSAHGYLSGPQTSAPNPAPSYGVSSAAANSQAMIEGYCQQNAERAEARQQSIQQTQANLLNTISQWQAPSQQRSAEQRSEIDYGSPTQTQQWADESNTTYTPEPSSQRTQSTESTTAPRDNSASVRAEEARRQQEELRKWQAKQEALINGDNDSGQNDEKNGILDTLNSGGSKGGSDKKPSIAQLANDPEARAMREQQRREWVTATGKMSTKDWRKFGEAVESFNQTPEGYFDKQPTSRSSRPVLQPDGTISTLKEKTRSDDEQWLRDIKSPRAKY